MKPTKRTKRIGRFFTFLTDGVYRAVSTGPLGRLFGSYDRADRYFHKTAIVRAAQPKRNRYRGTTLRGRVAAAIDQSVLRRGAYGLMEGFLQCSLRTVGAFFLTSGIYSALISWLLAVVWSEGQLNGFYLFWALAVALFGTVLLFSDRSVGYAVYKGRLTGTLLHGSLGISSDAVKEIPPKGKTVYAVAVPLGMLFGSATALTGPTYPAFALLLLVVTLIVLTTPEVGVLLALITAPFSGMFTYGTLWLVLIVVLSGVSYLAKLLRGTRAFRMEIQDFALLMLLFGTLFTGISAAGGSALRAAGLSALLLLIYFPAVNVLATPTWLLRCRWGLLFSAGATALMGIAQFVLALITALNGVYGVSMERLGVTVRAGFTDNAIFAYFMVLAFPFALHAFLRAKNATHRVTAGFCCVTVLTATVLTWAQSAWLALLVEIVVLVLLCQKKSFPYILIIGLLIPVALVILPASYRAAFFSFVGSGNMTAGNEIASAVFFAGGTGFFSNAAGALRLIFGFGANGLERVCVLYGISNTGILSFWWVRLFEGGVLSVLLPLIFLFFLLQNCFSVLPHGAKAQSAVAPASGISMVFGVLVLSFFDNAWRDPAALLLFVVLCAIISADARHRRALYIQPENVMQTPVFAELEYHAKKARGKHKNAAKEAIADESE